MRKFGKTWWGEQWLKALHNIDYSNRLPRGRAYASNGSIVSLEIKKSTISARVQGTRPSPYRITISVPVFKPQQQEKLLNAITRNQMLLSRLLNRQLPAGLLSIANANEIYIFPRTWKDLDMSCSCPDWAVPCKHLAAVVYEVANQIDQNPFLVFQLHEFDVLKLLQQKGLDISTHTVEKILHVNSLFGKIQTHQNPETSTEEHPDYSILPDLSGFLNTILTPNPLFFEKDFRSIVDNAMGRLAKYAEKFEPDQPGAQDEKTGSYSTTRIIFYPAQYQAAVVLENDNSNKELLPLSLIDYYTLASKQALENRMDYHERSFSLLYEVMQFVQKLCIRSAIAPQLLQVGDAAYSIRWIPARMDEEVKRQCTYFESKLERFPVVLELDAQMQISDRELSGHEQLNLICTTLVRVFFADGHAKTDIQKREAWDDVNLHNVFFAGAILQPGPDKSLVNTIQLWLRRLELEKTNAVPVIRVDENDQYISVSVDVDLRKEGRVLPLKEFLDDKKQSHHHIPLLKDLALIADYFPELEQILQRNHVLKFSHAGFETILVRILPIIKLLGVSIALPYSLRYLIRPAAGLRISQKEKLTSNSFMSLTGLLDYDWGVSLGDKVMDKDEFFKLVNIKRGLVKLRDSYIIIHHEDIEKLQKFFVSDNSLTSIDLLRAALSEEYDNAPVLLSEDVKKQIAIMLTPERIAVPPSVTANLRPYQVSGFQWLASNSKLGLGSLIADDMGLGKTIQVIAALQHFKDSGMINENRKALVAAPTSLISNWQKEVDKFAPQLKVAIYHGSQRKMPEDDFDVLLTSYGLVRMDLDKLQKHKWYALVIDESQAIKNPSAEQAKAIKKLKADVKIAMSGTPVENRLSDYWSVFDFINKGYLGSLKTFQTHYANPIQKEHDRHKAEIFRKATRPFLLRRLKTDKSIISDLPDKIENTLFCGLTPAQAATYQNVVDSTMETIEQSEGIARKGLILKLMTALKQICNHPAQYLKNGNPDASESGKTQLVLSLLDNILENNEKTLIFTQYKQMGDLLIRIIQQHTGMIPLFLHGELSRKQRDEMVDEFQNKASRKIFILSLKAGGTGLNLTAASNVIHYDLWWNPAVEAQATDRAYRIGQNRNVMVYRPLCKGTMEEKIDEMIRSKKQLADLTVGTGESWIGELSNNELRELIQLK